MGLTIDSIAVDDILVELTNTETAILKCGKDMRLSIFFNDNMFPAIMSWFI